MLKAAVPPVIREVQVAPKADAIGKPNGMIYCPNCKRTGVPIQAPPMWGLFLLIPVMMAFGVISIACSFYGFYKGDLIAIAIAVVTSPIPLIAVGVAFSAGRRIVYDDKSQRCSSCRYPWGMPV